MHIFIKISSLSTSLAWKATKADKRRDATPSSTLQYREGSAKILYASIEVWVINLRIFTFGALCESQPSCSQTLF
jgi:hypothetical protein